MLQTPPHTKVKTFRPQPDGSTIIDSHSTFKDLSSTSQEITRTYDTSRETLAADLIMHSEMIRNAETPELDLKITTDKKTGEPRFIVVTWLVNKEYYGR